MAHSNRKSTVKLVKGDRIALADDRFVVVDRVQLMPYGMARIWHGHLGLQHTDAGRRYTWKVVPA
uniref:HNH endonuclease n=1 Tax=Micrococcus phage Kurnik TaxID=3092208 RepID=A0AAU6R635_9CAUD